MPGFDLGHRIDRKDYDPAANACIGLRQFLFLLHAWVIDYYQNRPQEGLGHCSPDDRWRALLVNGEPGLLDSADDVASLFGVVRYGTLDHRGIRFENIRYGGDELRDLRRDCGSKVRLRFKIDPSDLLHARVWHPRLKGWVRGTAYREDYAQGLSLHVHKLVEGHNRRLNRVGNEDAHVLGLSELRKLVEESLPQVVDLGSRGAIARAVGIGSQHLLGGIDQQGRLGAPTGPWKGESLAPPLPGSPPRLTAPGAAVERAPLAPPQPGAVGQAAPALRPAWPRRVFEADDSIAHVKLSIERRGP